MLSKVNPAKIAPVVTACGSFRQLAMVRRATL
jgi:hypothetical protein